MNISEALSLMLDKGYCLWVGAGVTKHLTQKAPLWNDLVNQLEESANLPSNPRASFTERLEAVQKEIGRDSFQKQLRTNLFTPIADGVIELANNHSHPFTVPLCARQISSLGMMATSIVNFNFEPITSILFTHLDENFRIKALQPSDPRAVLANASIRFKNTKDRAYRSIYHPHGNLDIYGLCVATTSDYTNLEKTLAYQLACHQAFEETLVIVGMSLEDAYLRQQITTFKSWISKIIWFVKKDSLSKEIKEWVALNSITTVDVSNWEKFWELIEQKLPSPSKESSLHTWHMIIKKCFDFRRGTSRLSEFMSTNGLPTEAMRQINKNKGLDERKLEIAEIADDTKKYHELTKAYLDEKKMLI